MLVLCMNFLAPYKLNGIIYWVQDFGYSNNIVHGEIKYGSSDANVKNNKLDTKITAKSANFKVKKSKKYTITLKSGKNPVKKVQIKVKIGKKTYKLKTDKKGVAKFNTKKLKVGKYSVVISSGDGNYNINAKSKITIKK